jgi:hypothetical protein
LRPRWAIEVVWVATSANRPEYWHQRKYCSANSARTGPVDLKRRRAF